MSSKNNCDLAEYMSKKYGIEIPLVESIGEDLYRITISGDVLDVPDRCFENGVEIAQVIFEDGVKQIGRYAFSGCSNLYEVIFPNSLIHIGAGAFFDCSVLVSVQIPDSIQYIGRGAFCGCKNLRKMSIPFSGRDVIACEWHGSGERFFSRTDKAILDGYKYYLNRCKHFGYIFDIDIDEDIDDEIIKSNQIQMNNLEERKRKGVSTEQYTKMAEYVPDSLEEVVITSAYDINAFAFYDCVSIKKVTIPKGVKRIGYNAFFGCKGLKTLCYQGDLSEWFAIKMYEPPFYHIEEFVAGGHLLKGDIAIDEGIVKIVRRAFIYYDGLTSVLIPDSVETIECSAFYGCRNLKSITIGKGVKKIERDALYCKNLSSIYYNGTKAQWRKIIREGVEEENCPDYVVHCINGDTRYLPLYIRFVNFLSRFCK